MFLLDVTLVASTTFAANQRVAALYFAGTLSLSPQPLRGLMVNWGQEADARPGLRDDAEGPAQRDRSPASRVYSSVLHAASASCNTRPAALRADPVAGFVPKSSWAIITTGR